MNTAINLVKKLIIKFFANWKQPLKIYAVAYIGVFIGLIANFRFLDAATSLFFLITLLGLIASIVRLLKRRQFAEVRWSILWLAISFGIFILSAPMMSAIIGSQPDKFADDLVIPSNIVIHSIHENDSNSYQPVISLDTMLKNQYDFQLYDSHGSHNVYSFKFWSRQIPKGIIYLKAYEVTKNQPLSVESLPARSKVVVYNPTSNVDSFELKGEFVIYEGDEWKYYAARFEVWFKPDDGTKEYLLVMKNYKIEGWQR